MSLLDTGIQAWNFITTLPAQVYATAAGLVFSWCGTQTLKFRIPKTLSDDEHKFRVRAMAFGLAFVPAFGLWPSHDLKALIWCALVGICAPIAYIGVMRALYHFFPWMEKKMSARPVIRYDATGTAVGIRMNPDDPTDRTHYFGLKKKDEDPTQPRQQ